MRVSELCHCERAPFSRLYFFIHANTRPQNRTHRHTIKSINVQSAKAQGQAHHARHTAGATAWPDAARAHYPATAYRRRVNDARRHAALATHTHTRRARHYTIHSTCSLLVGAPPRDPLSHYLHLPRVSAARPRAHDRAASRRTRGRPSAYIKPPPAQPHVSTTLSQTHTHNHKHTRTQIIAHARRPPPAHASHPIRPPVPLTTRPRDARSQPRDRRKWGGGSGWRAPRLRRLVRSSARSLTVHGWSSLRPWTWR